MSRGRIMLLSYHFPPSTAAGALRWEKLARFAADRGYGLDVVTLAPESLDQRDDTRLAALPEGTTVHGVAQATHWSEAAEDAASAVVRSGRALRPAREDGSSDGGAVTRPMSLAPDDIGWSLRPRALLRAWWSWKAWARDRRWAQAAAARAAALVDPRIHRAIVTCGPPHMVHATGGRLARRAGLPHIMDLRDPWSLVRRLPEELATPMSFALARRAERTAVRRAELVVTNTDALRDAMRAEYPDRTARIITVMNGYDRESLPEAPRDHRRFTVTYAGALYLDRDPRLFLRAAGRVVKVLGLTAEQFGVEFLGTGESFGSGTLAGLAREEGMSGFVTVHPRKPRGEALAFLAGSTMLLNLPQDSRYAIPSKVFEYLMFPSWVLALAAPGSPTATVLAGTGVDVVAPDDVDGMARVLEERINAFFRGERPSAIAGRERLSRSAQAEILFDALEPHLHPAGSASR